MHIHSQVKLVVLLPILAAACAPANLDPSDPGLSLLVVGLYSDASRVLAAELKQDPDNPYIAFNLAAAYQNLDRMDLAAPLYRKVIRDGGDVVPRSATD